MDMESTLIVIGAVAIGADRFTRGGLNKELQSRSVRMPQEGLAKANLSSIASASGLNREKVRRKVKQLREIGMLRYEIGGGLGVSSEVAEQSSCTTSYSHRYWSRSAPPL